MTTGVPDGVDSLDRERWEQMSAIDAARWHPSRTGPPGQPFEEHADLSPDVKATLMHEMRYLIAVRERREREEPC